MRQYAVLPLFAALLLNGCLSTPTAPPPPAAAQPVLAKPAVIKPVRVGLALGGGAARGFAHIGVIKVLEAQGIYPDIIVGSSAGAVVGALYASGTTGFDLQKLAFKLDETKISPVTCSPWRSLVRRYSNALPRWVGS